MNVDYLLTAGAGSALRVEQDGDNWYAIVRDGEVNVGDLVADEYHSRAFEVIGFGAPFYVAEVYIKDAEDNYHTTITIDHHEAVRNFDSYETIEVCQAFLRPVCHHHGNQQQNDNHIALASGWV